MKRGLDERVLSLERLLQDRLFDVSPGELGRIVVEGRAEGMTEMEILDRLVDRDPLFFSRGQLQLSEYCGICDPISPIRDLRVDSRSRLQRLLIHLDRRALCVCRNRRDPRLPIEPMAIDPMARPQLFAALSLLVDDLDCWKHWWASSSEDRRPLDLSRYYLSSAEALSESWREESPASFEKLGREVKTKVAKIRALPDPLLEICR
ncbi:MAG: hypothetical protein H6807_14025 [Planctomycetes bacterium]|nr:hypothetical protein [Planctomycetota bacterium]